MKYELKLNKMLLLIWKGLLIAFKVGFAYLVVAIYTTFMVQEYTGEALNDLMDSLPSEIAISLGASFILVKLFHAIFKAFDKLDEVMHNKKMRNLKYKEEQEELERSKMDTEKKYDEF